MNDHHHELSYDQLHPAKSGPMYYNIRKYINFDEVMETVHRRVIQQK